MAETAGLVVGVVALAGVFKDCVELFEYISASRSMGRDYELLIVKLDVEKTLLLQWSDRVRLLDLDHDVRLNNYNMKHAVSRVLSSLQLLLSDSHELQNRYGMRSERGTVTSRFDTPLPGLITSIGRNQHNELGETRTLQFVERFQSSHHARQLPAKYKVRWVIRDKEKFEGLITQISYFVSKLNQIVPDTTGIATSMLEEDLDHLRLEMLQTVLSAATGNEARMLDPTERAIERNCTRRILNRFWFRVMDDRRLNIAVAHQSTLSWSLKPPNGAYRQDWDDLSHWLQHDSGIYWVAGKAGSGKSTLMKYLHQQEEMKELLQNWAGNAPLTIANFFFYALGTHEQKSQEGLVRALLYQIMDSEPALIPVLFPHMWQEAHISENAKLDLPSPGEAKNALAMIRTGLKTSRKFCLLIDGLDEYSGNYMEGIAIIHTLVANPNVKIIVSSRPIPSCVQAFSEAPKLELQYLTRKDMENYIDDTISSHTYMKRLATMEPESVGEIKDELIKKASGVFLWVALACRSLIEGFAAYDNLSELRKRVDDLPPELEDLFQHMLNKIEPRYQQQAATTLRLCYQAQLSHEENLPSIGLAIMDQFGMDPHKVSLLGKLTNDEKRARCEVLEGRLRSRCCGLLEIWRLRRRKDPKACFCKVTEWVVTHDELVDSRVIFLHRTVFDFFSQPGAWDLPCLRIATPACDIEAVLACVYLQLATMDSSDTTEGESNRWINFKRAMSHAACADASPCGTAIPVLLCLEKLLQRLVAENPYRFQFRAGTLNEFPYSYHDSEAELLLSYILAIEAGMIHSVCALGNQLKVSEAKSNLLLLHAIKRPFLKSMKTTVEEQISDVSIEVVRHLLTSGIDPSAEFSRNIYYPTMTPWKCWLEERERRPPEWASQTAEITQAFIDHGADSTMSGDSRGTTMVT